MLTSEGKRRISDPVVPDQSGRMMPVDPLGTNAPDEQKIRLKAYEIYEQRGRMEGRELDDWLQAEHQIK